MTSQVQHATDSPDRAGASQGATVSGLRANSFAALVMLLIEFGLGSWVNLNAQLPAADHGQGSFAAFEDAVAKGPVGLSIHALVGTLLIITAISAVVRAALVRRATLIALAALSLLAIVAAWLFGAKFVGDANSGASLGMAIATGMAILGYASILFAATPAST